MYLKYNNEDVYLLQEDFGYFTVVIDCCNMKGCKPVTFRNIQDIAGLCKKLFYSSVKLNTKQDYALQEGNNKTNGATTSSIV